MAVFKPFKLEKEDGSGTAESDSFCIYREETEGCIQTGVVGCASIDEYGEKKIRKHENTRADKVEAITLEYDKQGFIREPIFLTYYKRDNCLTNLISRYAETHPCDFSKSDKKGVKHTYWIVKDEKTIEDIKECLSSIDVLYIADGHHRCASVYNVGMLRRERDSEFTGEEEFNYMLSAVFPHDELLLMEFNRGIRDLNGHSPQSLISSIENEGFSVTAMGNHIVKPKEKHEIIMTVEGQWYSIKPKEKIEESDAVKSLDATILQDRILEPVFGIHDPRTDKRLEFFGGIHSTEELVSRLNDEIKIGFILYPVSIEDMFRVADNDQVMPPKSTWFEPKMGTDLFIRKI
ncbi:MAG: DUF1015 family protein [Peptostreptococcaceae bacterium]|nr:DUF1015 family protein [Peptostreptococcaceae bacterium]MDY5738809.1 DUF1015 family protein [Anaerovoracaceae bacterium]